MKRDGQNEDIHIEKFFSFGSFECLQFPTCKDLHMQDALVGNYNTEKHSDTDP